MIVIFEPSRASGKVQLPPSKSIAHRALILAGLCSGQCILDNLPTCDDIQATEDILRRVGCSVDRVGSKTVVRGLPLSRWRWEGEFDCRESGSTLRFFIPLALTAGHDVTFVTAGRLLDRPLGVYKSLCEEKGWRFFRDGDRLVVSGNLSGGEFYVPGNSSSQFLSGLLLALPFCKEDSILHIIPPIVSRPYFNMTMMNLREVGVSVEANGNTVKIAGNQQVKPIPFYIEGDESAAVYYEMLRLMGQEISYANRNPATDQGDGVCTALMESLKAGYCSLDLSDYPDLAPMLFCFAALNHGGAFTGIARLRDKESDRISAMSAAFDAMEIPYRAGYDTFTVSPCRPFPPMDPISGAHDHRIVMALSILLSFTGGELTDAEAVSKSDPAFFENLRAIGLKFEMKDDDEEGGADREYDVLPETSDSEGDQGDLSRDSSDDRGAESVRDRD